MSDEYNIDVKINNIISKDKFSLKKNGLFKCEMQLATKKKISNGYDMMDSVLDVIQDGYAISYGDDYLFTYGIGPCCGVVLYDDIKSILFHLDGTILPNAVKEITDSFGFNSEAKVLICPGFTCDIPGSFKYKNLEKLYNDNGYDTIVRRIDGHFGYIGVSANNIRIGTEMIKENEILFDKQISRKY